MPCVKHSSPGCPFLQCSQVFCEPCIANLGGKAHAKDVHDVETWRCFSCDPVAVAKGR